MRTVQKPKIGWDTYATTRQFPADLYITITTYSASRRTPCYARQREGIKRERHIASLNEDKPQLVNGDPPNPETSLPQPTVQSELTYRVGVTYVCMHTYESHEVRGALQIAASRFIPAVRV